jgi:hypothetical protein
LLSVAGLHGACANTADEPDEAAPAAELTDDSNGAGEEPTADEAVGASSLCVSEYTPETLRERAFAFDGTVVDVGRPSTRLHRMTTSSPEMSASRCTSGSPAVPTKP